ncbi:hypothetical protein [Geodermatophilus sp. SYSU D00698]
MTHSTGRRDYHEVGDIPPDFVDYLKRGVHTGRGTGHQIATTNTIIKGLAAHPRMKRLIAEDRICYFAGAKSGRKARNVDLVLGPPGPGARFDDTVGMLLGMPTTPIISGEYKTIMTEHGKNAGNRRTDFTSHAHDARHHVPDAFVFAVCPVNAADQYFSYTAHQWRSHGDGRLQAARAIDTLSACLGPQGVDLLWTPVVVANNDEDPTSRDAHWLRGYPQPPDGDELGWGHFKETLARACVDRVG